MIAIIVPFFNAADTLPRLISALKAQLCTEFVALFVDDMSTDDGASIIAASQDSRFIVLNGCHRGPGAARNIGLDKADELRVEYISFVDADDIPHPEMLNEAKNRLESSGADIVHFEWSSSYNGLPNPDSIGRPSIHVWNKLYRRQAITGIRFIDSLFAEDLAFFIETECRNVRRTQVLRPLYTHVLRPGSLWETRDPALMDASLRKVVVYVNNLMCGISNVKLRRQWYGFYLTKLLKQWLRALECSQGDIRCELLHGFDIFLRGLIADGLLNPFRVGGKNFRRCLSLRLKAFTLHRRAHSEWKKQDSIF